VEDSLGHVDATGHVLQTISNCKASDIKEGHRTNLCMPNMQSVAVLHRRRLDSPNCLVSSAFARCSAIRRFCSGHNAVAPPCRPTSSHVHALHPRKSNPNMLTRNTFDVLSSPCAIAAPFSQNQARRSLDGTCSFLHSRVSRCQRLPTHAAQDVLMSQSRSHPTRTYTRVKTLHLVTCSCK
jgi:hypothetical protein